MEPVTVTIDRDKWDRGNGERGSVFLLGPHGKCCLGFAMNALGYSDELINLKTSPATFDMFLEEKGVSREILHDSGLVEDNASYPSPYLVNTEECTLLMEMNDRYKIKEQEREIRISEMFGKLGFKVEFIN